MAVTPLYNPESLTEYGLLKWVYSDNLKDHKGCTKNFCLKPSQFNGISIYTTSEKSPFSLKKLSSISVTPVQNTHLSSMISYVPIRVIAFFNFFNDFIIVAYGNYVKFVKAKDLPRQLPKVVLKE